MGSLTNPARLKNVTLDGKSIACNTHSAVYVAKDVSAFGLIAGDLCVIVATPTKAGGDFVGAREAGTAADNRQGIGVGLFVPFIVEVSGANTVELLDDSGAAAEANTYYFKSRMRMRG